MSEGPQEFDYRAAYIAEQGTRQYAERELQEARRRIAALEEFVQSMAGADWGDYDYTLYEHAKWARNLMTDAPQQSG